MKFCRSGGRNFSRRLVPSGNLPETRRNFNMNKRHPRIGDNILFVLAITSKVRGNKIFYKFLGEIFRFFLILALLESTSSPRRIVGLLKYRLSKDIILELKNRSRSWPDDRREKGGTGPCIALVLKIPRRIFYGNRDPAWSERRRMRSPSFDCYVHLRLPSFRVSVVKKKRIGEFGIQDEIYFPRYMYLLFILVLIEQTVRNRRTIYVCFVNRYAILLIIF